MNDIDTASLAAKVSVLEARVAKLEATLRQCVAVLKVAEFDGEWDDCIWCHALIGEDHNPDCQCILALSQAQEALNYDFAGVASNPPFGREELPQPGPHKCYPRRPAGEYRTPPEVLETLEGDAR